jgi:sugar phosphate isomerase/epimerase
VSDQLVLSHYSIRWASFPERVRAAAAAGYAGIGLYLREYERLRAAGHRDSELVDILAEHGQRVYEIEAIRGWASTGAVHEQYLRDLDIVDDMVAAFGPAHHVQVIGPYQGGLDEAAAGYAEVCDRLAVHGMGAAIEFLPEMSNIPDAASAWEIVGLADRGNGGLCVDSWHHFRGADDLEMLAAIPSERVLDVQLNDGPPRKVDPDYYTDCTRHRLIPGTGAFDLVGFVRTLDASGVDVPFSVEVISQDLERLPPEEAARRMADGTRAVLAAARGGSPATG